MVNSIKANLERDRARLVECLRQAKAGQREAGDISIGFSRQRQAADYQDAIDRIDHNLRIIADADRT